MKNEIATLLKRVGRAGVPTSEPCPYNYLNTNAVLYHPKLESYLKANRTIWPQPIELFEMMMENPQDWLYAPGKDA